MIYLYTDQYSEILFITNKPSTDKNDQLIVRLAVNDLNDLIILLDLIDRYERAGCMEPVFELKDLIKLLQAEIE
jgi:hypothetical protein